MDLIKLKQFKQIKFPPSFPEDNEVSDIFFELVQIDSYYFAELEKKISNFNHLIDLTDLINLENQILKHIELNKNNLFELSYLKEYRNYLNALMQLMIS